MMMVKPTLNYFSICGRGELARLIAAAGEVEIEDKTWSPAFGEDGNWRPGYKAIGEARGFPGTMPILEHGDDFAVFQAHAVENYLASISPKFKDLTPQQKAKDLMFALIKGDINVPTENVLFKKITPADLKPIMEKYYGISLKVRCQMMGFINGLSYPTPADLAVVVICTGCMPFQAASHMAGVAFDGEKYPKTNKVVTAAMNYPSVAKFLKESEHQTLKADPFGIMPEEYHN